MLPLASERSDGQCLRNGNPKAEVDIRILLRQILAIAPVTDFVGLELAASARVSTTC